LDSKNNMSNTDTLNFICQNPLVPVYFNADAKTAIAVLQASYDAGLRVFEFTNRGVDAPQVYKELKAYKDQYCADMLLGIGTISTAFMAEEFIKVGVEFIVQPGISSEVAEVCSQNNTTWTPGVMTPTEIYAALNLGAGMVKIFPANIMGSAYIKALRGPMPHLKIMVTGGIEATEASLHEWFGAGANVLGLGSQLFKNLSNLDTFKTEVSALNTLFKSNYLKP
jgi:2-dehydro-3-deoxyphosphogluconate aldolase / (4S)-4-hydroxy-2-oxoglutarate aldolase